jgi:hypothetical protein
MFDSVCFSPDYTRTASEIAENRDVITSLRDESLVAQEPLHLAGAAEGVWLDSKSIHPFAFDRTMGGTRKLALWSALV